MKDTRKNKSKSTLLVIYIVLVILVGIAVALVPRILSPNDKCTDQDWEIGNCVAAGECEPNIKPDNATYDCFDKVKDYDSKFNPSL